MSKGEKLQIYTPKISRLLNHLYKWLDIFYIYKKKNPSSYSHFHHQSNNNKNGTSLPLLLPYKLEMYTTTFDPIKAKEKNCPIIICNIKK